MAGNTVLPISFFKIILKTNLQSLKLPKKFTEKYGGALSNPVLLKPPDGTDWKVYWTKQNGEVWFQKGWNEFAQNYSLDHGHLVVFKYGGTPHFDVLILDQSALEIHYPSCDFDQSDDDWPDQKPKQKLPILSPPPYKNDRGENSAAQRSSLSLNWPRGARAQEVAAAFISNNPFFTVTINPINLAGSRLYVPGLEGYVENIEKVVKLQIGERSWNVKLLRLRLTSGRRFCAGWSLFAKESGLQTGDVCVFEFINREEPVFEVHISKSHS
ncbi:B3 domain-containing transcription factor VRN1-like [Lotus japonicus]|uniref:B3 domain-containing transcription factor VRN1-like n=1 Tax=Lotus japonicus TaxID=34305 RepID=UPI002586964E|nr:B3 domain-containing transcription factor VRN1-like [Lotus japonicus]